MSRRSDKAVSHSEQVVDGIRLHVTSSGSLGDGLGRLPAVLLVHGLATSSALWRDVAPQVCASADDDVLVLAPDLAQLGSSERSSRRIDLATQARLLLGLLDTCGAQRFLAVGHGLGGAVAVHLAALAGPRLAGLALLDTPLHPEVWPTTGALPLLVPGVRAACARALPHLPWLAEQVLARAVGRGSDAIETRPLDRYVAALREPGAARGLVQFATAVDPVAVEAAWQIVIAHPPPSLVMWGVEDHLHDVSYGHRLAGEIGSAWIPVAGAGHLLPEERPERVAEELAAFHAELSGG